MNTIEVTRPTLTDKETIYELKMLRSDLLRECSQIEHDPETMPAVKVKAVTARTRRIQALAVALDKLGAPAA